VKANDTNKRICLQQQIILKYLARVNRDSLQHDSRNSSENVFFHAVPTVKDRFEPSSLGWQGLCSTTALPPLAWLKGSLKTVLSDQGQSYKTSLFHH
jgi:hypothetical protein